MNTKKIILTVLSMTLCLTLLFTASFMQIFADSTAVKKKKSELSDVKEEITNAKSALSAGKQESTALTGQIKTLENNIYSTELEINKLQQAINVKIDEINTKSEELRLQESNISTQNDALNERLRAMYKNGDSGLLAVVFGSSSITELMTNLDMVERIYDSDAELLEEMQDTYGVIYDKKEELQGLKEELIASQSEIQSKKTQLEKDKASLSAKKSEVDQDNKALEKQIDSLNNEAKAITAEILKLQSAESYVGGSMLWPSAASTYVSSPFGNRLHPILKVYKLHTGIDIAASSGTNILASNAGTVISACYNSSGYGYMIMLDHGGGIVTLYAHCSKLLVKNGDKVSRGQAIAKVGSTGMSTGPHLHFEVRINGVYKNPLEYVSR